MMRGPARAGTATVIVHLGPLADDVRGERSDAPARAGLVVGRSVGGAVARNRVKRRLRHILATLLVDVPDGWGVVVRARDGASSATAAQLGDDVRDALRRCLARVGHGPTSAVGVS